MPGQIRFFLDCFRTERPGIIEAAFRRHCENEKFFPKPGDIKVSIAAIREEMADRVPEYHRIDWKAVEREQSRPEWMKEFEGLKESFDKLCGKKMP